MIAKFMRLESDKRERIINAALEEFEQKGYKNASTNEIVKKANISKGLLFHYFQNKKGLYMFLCDYAQDIFLKEFYSKVNYNENDIIRRFRQITVLKIELIQKHHKLYDFMLSTVIEDDVEIKPELEKRIKSVLTDASKKIFENIDTSGFKEGLNIKTVSEIIMWVSQGFNDRVLDQIKLDPTYKAKLDMHGLVAEFDLYLELLKDAFYK